jgi:hypothetical protein
VNQASSVSRSTMLSTSFESNAREPLDKVMPSG